MPATEGPSAAEVTARDRAERVARPDVVHVTIDRVEIRATLAPPAPAAPDAAAVREPPVPLHDYLAGRSR
ncbi:hypothetical protein [Agromyces sp. ZXT2-3]|uniref:hypothetical protein n=1 Tax=Agromyces sp. ZXT2-3 TaxID=3461152 RepID=UPI004054B51D